MSDSGGIPPRFVLALGLLATGTPGCYAGPDGDSQSGTETGATVGATESTTEGATETSDSDSGGPPVEFEPAPAVIRLLLARHYTNAVRDLLGPAAAAVVTPPDDSSLNGFEAIAAAQLALSDSAVEAYETSARAAAAVGVDGGAGPNILAHVPCNPIGPDDAACHDAFVRAFGRLAWRRPLTEEEVARYVAVAQTTSLDAGNFWTGVEYAVATFLQSPNFLYQVELGTPVPDQPGVYRLTGLELATRMSFFLVDTTPDAALLDDAEAGALDTAAGVRTAALALLGRNDARVALSNFYSEVLHLRELEAVPKDVGLFPQWTPALAAALRTETLTLIEDVVWQQDGDFRDILDTPFTFVNVDLASFYGIAHPSGGMFTKDFLKVPQPDVHKRGGILGHASVLARFSHISSSSPTLRGKFVREALMCQTIPAPPPDVDTALPPSTEDAPTMRDRLEAHMQDPACNGCHIAMDGVGFGLENYDSIGLFRTMENGAEIDTVSELAPYGEFDGARALGTLLRDAEEVSLCAVRNLFRHATGHVETSGELPTLQHIDALFIESGYSVQDLLVELVASQTFRNVGEPE